MSGDNCAKRLDFFAVDEIAAGIADEDIAEKIRAVGVATVDGDAGRAGEISRRAPASFNRPAGNARHAPFGADDAPGFFGADAIDLGGWTIDGNIDQWRRHGKSGVAV